MKLSDLKYPPASDRSLISLQNSSSDNRLGSDCARAGAAYASHSAATAAALRIVRMAEVCTAARPGGQARLAATSHSRVIDPTLSSGAMSPSIDFRRV